MTPLRNGQSTKRKWSALNDCIDRLSVLYSNDRIYLTDISFGICTHPFNPEGVSFRRKPFSKLKENEYGIAFKGTPINIKGVGKPSARFKPCMIWQPGK